MESAARGHPAPCSFGLAKARFCQASQIAHLNRLVIWRAVLGPLRLLHGKNHVSRFTICLYSLIYVSPCSSLKVGHLGARRVKTRSGWRWWFQRQVAGRLLMESLLRRACRVGGVEVFPPSSLRRYRASLWAREGKPWPGPGPPRRTTTFARCARCSPLLGATLGTCRQALGVGYGVRHNPLKFGAGDGTRTRDPQLGRLTLWPTELLPLRWGSIARMIMAFKPPPPS